MGIALHEPNVQVRAATSDAQSHEIVGLGEDHRLIRSVAASVSAMTKGDQAFRIELLQSPPRHIGLGTGTAIHLAAAMAAAKLAGLYPPTDDLALLSGRGGTSGIGVNVFAKGGVIFDGGHALDPEQSFVPSGYRKPSRLPPIITRLMMPPHWRVLLILPSGETIAGHQELEFFQQQLPLPATESLQALAWAYHGVAAAIVQHELSELSVSLRHLHAIGMKKREVDRQSSEVRNVIAHLHNRGDIAAGMSSFGPLLYAIVDQQNRSALDYVTEIAQETSARQIQAQPNNTGYHVEFVDDS